MGNRTLRPDPSKRHPQAGNHVIVQNGPLKGTTIKVIDFIQNQYQGKSLKALRDRGDLTAEITVLENRGHEFTEKTIYAAVPETPPRYILLDDTEIQVEAKPKLKALEGGKDDSGTTTTGNIEGAGVSGGLEGRAVSGTESEPESEGEADGQGQGDSEVGSGAGQDSEPVSRPSEPEVSTGSETKPDAPKQTQRRNRGSGSTK